jgi:hypothetical protein
MYEAICTKCGETFNPNYFDHQGRLDCEHYATEDGAECYGQGRLLGAYGGADPNVPTVNEVGDLARAAQAVVAAYDDEIVPFYDEYVDRHPQLRDTVAALRALLSTPDRNA